MPALRACLAILVLRDETDRAVARPPTLSAFPDSCRLATRFGRHPGREQALAPRGMSTPSDGWCWHGSCYRTTYLEPSPQGPNNRTGGNAGHGCAREHSRHGPGRDRSGYRNGERSPTLPQGALVAGSAAASLVGLAGNHVSMARAQGLQAAAGVGARKHYHIPVSGQTVHWGYFSKSLPPVVEVDPATS